MNESRLENECGLIIDPQELIRIREACEQRRRELEAAGALPPLRIAPEWTENASRAVPASPPMSEAERFAAAVLDMPPNVRRFFEHEEPARQGGGSWPRIVLNVSGAPI